MSQVQLLPRPPLPAGREAFFMNCGRDPPFTHKTLRNFRPQGDLTRLIHPKMEKSIFMGKKDKLGHHALDIQRLTTPFFLLPTSFVYFSKVNRRDIKTLIVRVFIIY
jgi:hypothetical protein